MFEYWDPCGSSMFLVFLLMCCLFFVCGFLSWWTAVPWIVVLVGARGCRGLKGVAVSLDLVWLDRSPARFRSVMHVILHQGVARSIKIWGWHHLSNISLTTIIQHL